MTAGKSRELCPAVAFYLALLFFTTRYANRAAAQGIAGF